MAPNPATMLALQNRVDKGRVPFMTTPLPLKEETPLRCRGFSVR